jgi:hypothetical protein
MPTTDIRPLSFGELLDRTFTYYRRGCRPVGARRIARVADIKSNVGATRDSPLPISYFRLSWNLSPDY